MNTGKTLFAQLMEFVPWTSFSRIVARYAGDARSMVLPCSEHFRIMAYAQITWRESLRDIEATLGANPTKLYGMGLRQAVRRSTLADANERRDWHIWCDLATVLIRRARKLYAQEDLGLDVNIAGNVYALDSSTIDLCLSLFDWAPFRSTKAAIKLHTLLDLRGAIPSFIHISDGKLHDVNVLDILPVEAGAFYVMDRGYVDFGRLYAMHQSGAFFVTRAKSNIKARRVYSAPVDKATFHVMRHCASAFVRNALEEGERGVVVNVASIAAFEGSRGHVAYSASKAGVVGMMLPAARELADWGIRVVTVAPGLFDTPMLHTIAPHTLDKMATTALWPKRFGTADEFSGLVAHILDNRYLNAEVIRIDGGARLA